MQNSKNKEQNADIWVDGKGLHFSLITEDDLLRVDHSGKVVDGGNNRRLNYGKAAQCATRNMREANLLREAIDGPFSFPLLTARPPPAAYAIHAEIHKARPDVLCAAHCHSTYGRAMCATGRTLDMLTQDFCTFYQDHVLYP